MIKIKILFVTLDAIENNTSAMIRNSGLLNGLILSGHEIDLLTKSPIKDNTLYNKTISWSENINIIRIKSNATYNSLIQNKENFIGFIKKKILPLLRLVYHSFSLFDNTIYIAKSINLNILPNNYYDIVISSSDPKSSHYAVRNLIKTGLKYGKWIQYWGDPLTIDITNKSIYPKFYKRFIEKQLLFCANKIVYVSPFTLIEQKKMFPEISHKMNFIPIPYLKMKIQKDCSSEKITLGYFGDYNSRVRNIKPLYKLCKEKLDNFQLLIAGNSDLKLEEYNNISILHRISLNEIEKLESNCDILICILNLKGTQIPGKVYHYAATNKPILIVLDGERKELIQKYLENFDRYVVCDNNEKSILGAINYIRNSNKIYEPSPYFEPKAIAQQFLNLIK